MWPYFSYTLRDDLLALPRVFPADWKKANVVPVYKKNVKHEAWFKLL